MVVGSMTGNSKLWRVEGEKKLVYRPPLGCPRPARIKAMSGFFITFEGPDGAGKSTQVQLLREYLETAEPVYIREPGGTELGEAVRALLLDGKGEIDSQAEMYLFFAARAQGVKELINPALAADKIVIADRYHDSTIAYQGAGSGIEVPWPDAFPKPDLTFLLQIPAGEGLFRVLRAKKGGKDRMESKDIDFHERVSARYEAMAKEDPSRFVAIDATLSKEEIQAKIRSAVDQLLEVPEPEEVEGAAETTLEEAERVI
jgi:dTMP kinase